MLLPRQELFLYMYVRKEAVLSSQIEGTQSTLSDLLRFEMEAQAGNPIDDIREVIQPYMKLSQSMGCGELRTTPAAQCRSHRSRGKSSATTSRCGPSFFKVSTRRSPVFDEPEIRLGTCLEEFPTLESIVEEACSRGYEINGLRPADVIARLAELDHKPEPTIWERIGHGPFVTIDNGLI